MGKGYGYPSEAGEVARQWGAESGLEIDSTYGGKALAAIPGLTGAFQRVVFWHTYAGP
jgi:hypothetical protein